MKTNTVRTNFSLPADLFERLKKFAPKRKYSKFVQEAIDEKIRREAKKRLLAAAGTIDIKDHPEWAHPVKYVRKLREAGQKRRTSR